MSRDPKQEIERIRGQLEGLRRLGTELAQKKLANWTGENASGNGVMLLSDAIKISAAYGDIGQAGGILEAAEKYLLLALEEPFAGSEDEAAVHLRMECHLGAVVIGVLRRSERRWRDLEIATGLGTWRVERVNERYERSGRRQDVDSSGPFQLQYLSMVALERLWGLAEVRPVDLALKLPIHRRFRKVRDLLGKVALGNAEEVDWKEFDREVLELVGPHAYDRAGFRDLRPIQALMPSAIRWRGDIRVGAEKMFLDR